MRVLSSVHEGGHSALRPTVEQFIATILLSVLSFLFLTATPTHAKDAPLMPGMTRTQAQAFALGYALRTADARAVAYTQSVQRLKGVTKDDDPLIAGAEVARLSGEVPKLRRSEAASYTAVSALLARMGAPETLRAWAASAAATLNAPLVYTGDAKKLAKKEPDTARTLAALVEIQSLKAAADKQQGPLTLWLGVTGGKAAPWSADTGAYTADLHRAAAPRPLLVATARAQLRTAPPDTPAAARESLAALVPRGGGNLQNLATLAPASVTPEKVARAAGALLTLYRAEALAQTLDKSGQ